jgi:lysophospholipase L1-like esterase
MAGHMRKNGMAAVVLVLALALSGCGKCGPDAVQSTANTSEAVTTGQTESAGEASDKSKEPSVTAAGESKESSVAATDAETGRKTEAATEVQTGQQTEAVTEAQTEVQTGQQTEAETEQQTEAVTEAQTEQQTEAQTEVQTEVQTETQTESGRLTSPFSISFLGDSITVGYYSSYSYADLVCDDMGAVGYNYGISGNTLASDEGNGMVDRYGKMHSSDVIVVYGGSNDFYDDVVLGSITSWNNEEFYGALKNLCSGLKAQYPNAHIVFMTPLHGEFLGMSTSNDNGAGSTMALYVRAIKNVCADYDIPVLDLYDGFAINGDNYEEYTSDGLHPNEKGHKKIAEVLESYIRSLM